MAKSYKCSFKIRDYILETLQMIFCLIYIQASNSCHCIVLKLVMKLLRHMDKMY